jgi:benzaldehyde dehydrogenase (NAD)
MAPITVVEKATGAVLDTVEAADASAIDRVAQDARAAAADWAALPYTERAARMSAFARAVEARADALAELIMRETGSIRGKGDYEVHSTVDEFDAAAALARRPRGEVLGSSHPERDSMSVRRPVGVVAVLTPWNFPMLLAARVVAPALALGNVVVLKPSPETPLSGGAELAALASAAGLPAGVFQVVVTDIEGSKHLVSHPEVDMVHFTGSTAVGSEIAATTGRLLKKTSLELGGNNALVVLDDADVTYAAMLGAWSSFHYQGQTCISASRHLVHSSVAEAYTEEMVRRAKAISVGDTADEANGLGPIVNTRQLERAQRILTDSLAQGAVLREGGTAEGLFMRPTVVTDVAPGTPLWDKEVFAPIVPITTFETDDEAVRLVNATGYGLANAVVTNNLDRGQRIAHRLRSGMVHVNDSTVLDEASAPFGGIGRSGLGGRVGGEANYEEFTERQWVTVNRGRAAYPY